MIKVISISQIRSGIGGGITLHGSPIHAWARDTVEVILTSDEPLDFREKIPHIDVGEYRLFGLTVTEIEIEQDWPRYRCVADYYMDKVDLI